MKRQGITLVALVVTIVILLILAGVTIALVLGPDGMMSKARDTEVESRHGSILDKVSIRDAELELARNIGGSYTTREAFINQLVAADLLGPDDHYSSDFSTIYIGYISDTEYKHKINLREDLPESTVNLANMTLKIRTTSNNQTVEIPISNALGLTINWDYENDSEDFKTPSPLVYPEFTYPIANTYQVQIKGKVGNDVTFGDPDNWYINEHIVGIDVWGENGFYAINNFGAHLEGNIPSPTNKSFENVTSFRNAFNRCIGLTGNIPADLFANCPNLTSIRWTFGECENLTGTFPYNLLDNCPNVTDFQGAFYGCEKLTGTVPRYWDLPNAPEPFGCFCSCTGLSNFGEIPGLWKMCEW